MNLEPLANQSLLLSRPNPPGFGELDFEVVEGRTIVRKAYARSPLRLLTPGNHGSAAWVYMSNFGGGFVGGDRFELNVNVRAGAEAVLLTQSTTKVYRSPLGSGQILRARAGQHSSLVVWPDPVVCFAGASFSQRQEIHLGEGASLLLVDAVNCGRNASSERWLFDSFQSQVLVWREGEPIFLESLLLDAKSGCLAERNGRFNTHCMVFLTGPRWATDAMAMVSSLERASLGRRADLVVAASHLSREGVLLRLSAVSTEELALTLRRHLHFMPGKLGDDPWARKW